MKTAENIFSVGEEVIWTSGASGHAKTKRGVVEVVVPANKRPTAAQQKEADAYGQARDHQSYLIRVPGKTPAAKGKLYWPFVSLLSAAPGANQ